MSDPTCFVWYANPQRAYHAAGPDWVRSGKGVCGRDISKPGFTLRVDEAFRQACESHGIKLRLCKDCLRRILPAR